MDAITPWTIIFGLFLVLTFCVPFFICKIRNQVVEMNKKMVLMTEYLRMIAYETKTSDILEGKTDEKGRPVKLCPKCGKPNHPVTRSCTYCGYVW